MNSSIRLQHFLRSWKLARVTGIPEAETPPELTSLGKVTENIILKTLKDFKDTNSLLSDIQKGVRMRHSCQLRPVVENISVNTKLYRHTAAVILDIRQVFNRVWHYGLIEKLIRFRFPGYLINVIQSFFPGRSFQVRVEKELPGTQLIAAGVPQESTLSPLSFNLFSSNNISRVVSPLRDQLRSL